MQDIHHMMCFPLLFVKSLNPRYAHELKCVDDSLDINATIGEEWISQMSMSASYPSSKTAKHPHERSAKRWTASL